MRRTLKRPSERHSSAVAKSACLLLAGLLLGCRLHAGRQVGSDAVVGKENGDDLVLVLPMLSERQVEDGLLRVSAAASVPIGIETLWHDEGRRVIIQGTHMQRRVNVTGRSMAGALNLVMLDPPGGARGGHPVFRLSWSDEGMAHVALPEADRLLDIVIPTLRLSAVPLDQALAAIFKEIWPGAKVRREFTGRVLGAATEDPRQDKTAPGEFSTPISVSLRGATARAALDAIAEQGHLSWVLRRSDSQGVPAGSQLLLASFANRTVTFSIR